MLLRRRCSYYVLLRLLENMGALIDDAPVPCAPSSPFLPDGSIPESTEYEASAKHGEYADISGAVVGQINCVLQRGPCYQCIQTQFLALITALLLVASH
jgi:hypothetical protein